MKIKISTSEELNEILSRVLDKYLDENNIDQKEKEQLFQWISEGNSPYNNPYYMSNEKGYPIDFIEALRAVEQFAFESGNETTRKSDKVIDIE